MKLQKHHGSFFALFSAVSLVRKRKEQGDDDSDDVCPVSCVVRRASCVVRRVMTCNAEAFE